MTCLVADSDSVLLLDQNGNVIQTYSCSSLPGCQGLLFAVSVDPDGTSFWTGDSYSGDIWQIDIATGEVLQTIDDPPGALYGLWSPASSWRPRHRTGRRPRRRPR